MNEREGLLTASTGEGILIISNEHTEIKIIASPEEHAVITTNADERLATERAKAQDVVQVYEKSLDYAKRYFKKKELKTGEVEDLLKQGYTLSAHIGLFGGRQEEYVLQPRSNESVEHFFVIKAIEAYLVKNKIHYKLFETKEPDIVMYFGKKRVAIEVETGLKLRENNPRVEEKVKELQMKFGENWFFVVTDWQDKEQYSKYGKTYVRKEIPAVLKKNYLGSNLEVTDSETAKNHSFEVQTLPGIRPTSFETLKQNPMEANDNGNKKGI